MKKILGFILSFNVITSTSLIAISCNQSGYDTKDNVIALNENDPSYLDIQEMKVNSSKTIIISNINKFIIDINKESNKDLKLDMLPNGIKVTALKASDEHIYAKLNYQLKTRNSNNDLDSDDLVFIIDVYSVVK